MQIQLWSYNYPPEPTGIAPVSETLARSLRDRGHTVLVVAAHPHYPEPQWGRRLRPYREHHDGIEVLRLPLWIGRSTALERYRQELTFAAAQLLAVPTLGRPDVLVSVSPCFPALLPAMVNARLRSVPWILWLQDILPEGAVTTGIVEGGAVLRLARWLERAAYRRAGRIAVISNTFVENLREKGVPAAKLRLIYNPSTREPRLAARSESGGELRILSMGNIGFSQGLAPLVEAFEGSPATQKDGMKLVITGAGVAEPEVRSRVRSNRVEMPGLVDDDELERQLELADVGLVSQRPGGTEFNLPSKLMNFMAYGIPVLAAVSPDSEVARIVESSGGGWVVDPVDPAAFCETLARIREDRSRYLELGQAARRFADEHFSRNVFANSFEALLSEAGA